MAGFYDIYNNFTGACDDAKNLKPMWKLAAINNAKPKIVTRRQVKEGERVEFVLGVN